MQFIVKPRRSVHGIYTQIYRQNSGLYLKKIHILQRNEMLKEISEIADGSVNTFLESGENIFLILMGRPSIFLNPDMLWKTYGKLLRGTLRICIEVKSGKE